MIRFVTKPTIPINFVTCFVVFGDENVPRLNSYDCGIYPIYRIPVSKPYSILVPDSRRKRKMTFIL